MGTPFVREALPEDRPGVEAFLAARDTVRVARLDEVVDARRHPALVALDDGRVVGVLTWIDHGDSLEVLTLHAEPRGEGTGTLLLDGVRRRAATTGRSRVWLITTNDNLDALRFYQRRGFRLARLHAGAVDRSRARLKASIPEIGDHGIPIRDELELELRLGPGPAAEGAPGPAADGAPKLAADADLVALELALARRNEAAVPGGYEAVLAPDFVEHGQSGRRWTRDETLAALAREPMTDVPTIVEFEVVALAPDVRLVTYLLVVDAGGHVRRSRRSSIWIRDGIGWRMRFHQGTTVPLDDHR